MYKQGKKNCDGTSVRSLLTRRKLAETKLRAMRRGVWFTALNRLERSCINITINVVSRVRSFVLAKVLTPILWKLSSAMESELTRFARDFGFELALKASRIAQSWGHKSASRWTRDITFIRYLSVVRMNSAATWRM